MRRRRSPKVVWLPGTNANSLAGFLTSTLQVFDHNVTADPAHTGASVSTAFPVVQDGNGTDILGTDNLTLADIESSGYRLRRVVGKVYCSVLQQVGDRPSSVLCTAGLIILRVDEQTALPLQGQTSQQYNPENIRNGMDPWIWRRTWLLGNSQATNAPGDAFAVSTLGGSNRALGGNSDGPHLDQKTARIVSSEERLFFVASTTVVGAATLDQQGNDTQVQWAFDLRVLASMRTNQGNRRNASR